MNLLPFLVTVALAFFSCFSVSDAAPDARTQAVELTTQLRQAGTAARLPDEMRSLETTLTAAETYYRTGDGENAERHYRMAAQKAHMIRQQLAALQQPRSSASGPQPPQPHAIQQPHSSASGPQPRPEPSSATHAPIVSERLVGTLGEYRVQRGDTLRTVAGKLGISRWQLAAANGLKSTSKLLEGQLLRYNNRRIIPDHPLKDGIIVNIPDRMLYLFQKGKVSFSTAVALGTPTKTEQLVWETPVGRFRIVAKEKDPTWTVPPSIQEEMRLEGKEVITSIPPGPDNPLGKYAMKTSLPGILIHSTTKPWSIYTYASHGCIRVYPERMEALFNLIKVNTPGEIIYRPVKLAKTEDGRIFLEVHHDIYAKSKGLESEAHSLIRSKGLADQVDWDKIKRVIQKKAGVAEEITRDTATQSTQKAANGHSPS